MLKRPAIALLALSLTAETPPPATLSPYIRDGRFDPGDYDWMRGSFADATPAQKAEWQALWAWRTRCRAEQFAQVKAALARRGVTVAQENRSNGTGLCGSFAYALPQGDQGESWPAFQAAVARARPVAQAIIWSAALAQAAADPDRPDMAALLVARPVTDQALRGALSWDKGEVAGAPALDPAAQGVAAGLIWLAIGERDHANTVLLKKVVEKDGWPTIAKVGADASHKAWLLVQHADDDPVFQLDMLRLIAPLAARGEVAAKDHAYLHDRVMLKLTGRQRYGTQMICAGGRHVPQPLEDPAQLDARRAAAGLEPSAAYAARMERTYGPCPPDPVSSPKPKR